MAKYSFDLKMKILQEYQQGKAGIKALAKQHGITSYTSVQKWLAVYQKFGEEGLRRNRQQMKYTFHSSKNSDQGWGYQMKTYQKRLKEARIFQSMSRKGTCLDNIVMKNFFGLLKQEIYYGRIYASFAELKTPIEQWIAYYNTKRIKQKLGWRSSVGY